MLSLGLGRLDVVKCGKGIEVWFLLVFDCFFCRVYLFFLRVEKGRRRLTVKGIGVRIRYEVVVLEEV